MDEINSGLINAVLSICTPLNMSVLILLFMLLCYLNFLWSRRELYIYSWKVPGPLAFPFLGCSYLFLKSKFKMLKTFEQITQDYPKLVKLWLGPVLVYVIYEPKYIDKVLSSSNTMSKGEGYEIAHEVIGESLLLAKNWKVHRKALAPAFSQKMLDSYVEVFASDSAKFVQRLKELNGKKDVDWDHLIAKYILISTCKNTFGVYNLDTDTTDEEDVGFCLRKILEISTYRFFRPWYRINFIWEMSYTKKQFDYYNRKFDNITMSIVDKKIKEIQEMKDSDSLNNNTLNSLLKVPQLTEANVASNAKAMLIAATDTTTGGLTGAFILLGMMADVQQKVYEEVMEVIGPEGEIKASDLPNLKYTERVLKESLRFFPPAMVYARRVTEALDMGDFVLPKGATVAILPLLTQKNPSYWKDPLKFDPDRFLPEEVEKRHPCAYLPFSHGPRNCIGYHYSIMNAKTVLASVIREFKIFTGYKRIEDVNINLEPFLSLTNGTNIWFETRN